jgi:carboxymethylenebutenolidase
MNALEKGCCKATLLCFKLLFLRRMKIFKFKIANISVVGLALTLGVILITSQSLRAQQMICCQMQPQQISTTSFFTDPNFMAAHESPMPFEYKSEHGKFVTFKTATGADARGFLIKSSHKTHKVLLVFQEWWGVNGYIQLEAERLQKKLGNVDVMAVDLYDGEVAKNADEASKLVNGVKAERLREIIQGAIDHFGTGHTFETLGWCFGGGWSLQAAIMAGEKCTGCVIYYGATETDPAKLAKLHAPVLGMYGTLDKWLTPTVTATFDSAMLAAGKTLTLKSFAADHAFANPSNPHYNAEAKTEADLLAVEFLKAHL